jgi:hypothetical protein
MFIKNYNGLFTWNYPHGEHVLLHNDGAASCLIEWSGVDADLLTGDELRGEWDRFYDLVGRRLPEGYCAEWHLWRERDDGPAKRYLEYTEKVRRGDPFARRVRAELAGHLGPRGITNQVGLVLTQQPRRRAAFTAKSQIRNEAEDAKALLRVARDYVSVLPGARLGTIDEYLWRIRQSFDRRRFLMGARPRFDAAYSVAEQIIPERPTVSDRKLDIGGQTTKVLFLFLYPDTLPGWALPVLETPCAMHVMAATISANTRETLKAAEKSGAATEGLMSAASKGQDYQKKKADQLEQFRQWMTDNEGLAVRNFYVIHLHGTHEEVDAAAKTISKYVEDNFGQVQDSDYIQRYFFRMGQPGQAYQCDMFRPDSHFLVANMLPVQVWRSGDVERPEVLRQSKSGQLVTFSSTDKALLHSFIGGMTRSGKDANYVAEVAELYPLGMNFAFLEFGSSYKWICHAYGGPDSYLTLDPDNSVVNPLPLYENATPGPAPLNTYVCTETANALAFLLTGRPVFDQHQKAAAQKCLQQLYSKHLAKKPTKAAPNLPDYLEVLAAAGKSDSDFSVDQIAASKQMAANLESFLDTAEGRIFTRDENVVFRPGIIGVDLKDVYKASQQLALFYTIFLSLRFTQMAFSARVLNMIVLNELHVLVKLAPDVIGALCSSISRMGAKEKSFLTVITQDTSEVEALDPAILSQMPRRELLYRTDRWEYVAQRLGVQREGVVERWKHFPYPVGKPYRESIHGFGDDFYHLHLSFPNFILNLADSGPDTLTAKDEIERITDDPFERLQLLGKRLGRPI